MVALTGRAEAYYSDTRGEPQEFVSAAKYGYLFQGQHYHWQRQPRGTPAWGLPPSAFVAFLAESRSGRELGARAARAPADEPRPLARDDGAAAADAGDADAVSGSGVRGLGAVPVLRRLQSRSRRSRAQRPRRVPDAVSQRRRRFERGGQLDDPADRSRRSSAASSISASARSHARCLRAASSICCGCGASDPAFRAAAPAACDGAVLSASAFALRFFTPDHRDDRLLIVNLGGDLDRDVVRRTAARAAARTRLGACAGRAKIRGYGGTGIARTVAGGLAGTLPAESAIVLAPDPRRDARRLAAAGSGAPREVDSPTMLTEPVRRFAWPAAGRDGSPNRSPRASGSSPTASAATRRARSPA